MSKTNNQNNGSKRLSISLSGDTATLLEFLATSQGISQNEALRKAISTEAYLLKERKKGGKILIQKASQECCEIIFR
jgi:hypothetical protein